MINMKKVLSAYLTYVLVISGFLIGVSLRDFVRQFEKSNENSETTPFNKSAAGRLGFLEYSNSKPSERIETTGFNKSAAESLGFLEYSNSKPSERIETTGFNRKFGISGIYRLQMGKEKEHPRMAIKPTAWTAEWNRKGLFPEQLGVNVVISE